MKRSPVQKVFISRHVREALQRWAIELEDPEHVGVPMACREWVPLYGAPGVGVIYADTSGEEGWAAWTFASGVVYMVSGVADRGPLDRDLIIADKELVASTVGFFVLGEALQFQYVWEDTDNTVALSAIRSLTPSTPLSQRLCAARVIWCLDRSVFVMGERITSANNEWADIGSRPVTHGAGRQPWLPWRTSWGWSSSTSMSSTGGMFSETFQWEFATPIASDGRPFAVGDRMEQRARRASARRERDLAQVHDPSLEESAVAYLAADVQTTAGGSTQGWIWWGDFMRSLGESPEQQGELADGPEVRLRIEGYYLRFVVWLVHVRRVQVETARKYFAEALSAHVTYYGPPVPGYNMPRVRKMIKGMAKVIDASPRRPRRAVRTQDLKAALDELPLDSVSAVNARASVPRLGSAAF